MILLILLELWGKKMSYFSHIFMLRCFISNFHIFETVVPQNTSSRIIHRLLITFQIWFYLMYRSFDANHMQNYQTVAFHKKTDFVTHFSKNVDVILSKCFKTLFSVVPFSYLVWGLSTTVVLIYIKENTSKQVLYSLIHVRRWYWWCHQKHVVSH